MKKRTFFWNAVVVLSIGFAAMILAFRINEIFEKKESRDTYYDFIHSSLNSDILFIGTSHIAKAVSPIKLWNMNGYASYVLTAPGDGVARDNAILEMALDYVEPKLVVLDTDQYWEQSNLDYQVKSYHKFSDSFPLSETKIRTTLELYEDNNVRAELLFPWFVYHNRWEELKRDDFYSAVNLKCYKGNEYDTGLCAANLPKERLKKDNLEELDGEGLTEIEKFIQKCRDNNIEVLLVTLPYSADHKQRLGGMKIAEVASEYGVNYINFNEQEFFVDERTDFSDPSHMNISGARKMTEFLGRYISERYDVPDRRTEKEYSDKWNEDYQAYYELLKEKMIAETDLKKLLLICNEKAFNTSVYMNNALQCQSDDIIEKLLEDNPTLHIIDKTAALSMVGEGKKPIEKEGIYVWIYDAETGEKICEKFFEKTGDFLTRESETDEKNRRED